MVENKHPLILCYGRTYRHRKRRDALELPSGVAFERVHRHHGEEVEHHFRRFPRKEQWKLRIRIGTHARIRIKHARLSRWRSNTRVRKVNLQSALFNSYASAVSFSSNLEWLVIFTPKELENHKFNSNCIKFRLFTNFLKYFKLIIIIKIILIIITKKVI